MRLFIAIDAPENIASYLSSLQHKIHAPGLSLNKHHHITLKFLGDVRAETVDAICAQLWQISFSPFTLTLSEIGFFPSKHNPRVIFAGISPSLELAALQKAVDEKTKNIPLDNAFHPHFTLARAPRGINRETKNTPDSLAVEPRSFSVPSFSLKKSTLTVRGPVYEDVCGVVSR